jgi:hypothetical protein
MNDYPELWYLWSSHEEQNGLVTKLKINSLGLTIAEIQTISQQMLKVNAHILSADLS